jgi:hypothetical protein
MPFTLDEDELKLLFEAANFPPADNEMILAEVDMSYGASRKDREARTELPLNERAAHVEIIDPHIFEPM